MSTVQVDTINESTTGSGVTVDGVLIKDSAINASSVSGINRKNVIINGNFDIWQRGTSVTTGYGPDRFTYQNSGSTGTLAQGSFTAGQTDVPNNPRYFANLTVTGADDNANIAHRIEDVYTLSGGTATISFYAKHTTNAPTSFNVTSYQVFGSGGSTAVETSIATSQTTTTSWQKYTATVTFPSVSGKTIGAGSYLELLFINPNNETFDIQIAQVQLEKGSVATGFEYRPIGEELSLCQRYFYKTFVQSQAPAQNISPGRTIVLNYTGGGSGATSFNFPQVMRATPTMTFYNPYASNSSFRQWNSSNDYTPSTVDVDEVQIKTYYFNGVNITGGHINFVADAEL